MSTVAARRQSSLLEAARAHWPEALMEAAGLGLFMVSACVVTALTEHPASPLRAALDDALLRRALIGVAMGITAIGLIYSPWGKRSGAHLNPAVTLAFWRLGRIAGPDALLYVVAQVLGGALGVAVSAALLGRAVIADEAVNYVLTQPGAAGVAVAFVAEAAIAGLLMVVVLVISNRPNLNRYTGLAAGVLVALYITFEAPLSGMSMNPARSLASALGAMAWAHLWLYFVAPPLGMLAGATVYVRGRGAVLCCKLHHDNGARCIFRCGWPHP